MHVVELMDNVPEAFSYVNSMECNFATVSLN